MQKEHWMVVVSAIISGGILFGAKVFGEIGMSVYEMIVAALLVSIVLLGPFVAFYKPCRIKKGAWKLFPLFGIIGLVGVVADYGAVNLGVPVSIAVMLLYSQPLWTIIFDSLLLKEKLNRNKVIAVVLVLLGLVALINPFQVKQIGNIAGVILALAGGLSLSGWVLMGRVLGKRNFHPFTTKFGYSAVVLIYLLLLFPLLRHLLPDPSLTRLDFAFPITTLLLFALYVVSTSFLGNLLFFKALQKIPATDGGVILLLEPVSATILAALFLSQPLTWNVGIGGLLILASNYLVVR